MSEEPTLPDARAVAGVERTPRRWLYRQTVVMDGHVQIVGPNTCACCRVAIVERSGPSYCSTCVRHQRFATVALVLVGAATIALGRAADDLIFGLAPFLGNVAHTAGVFALCASLPLLIAAAMNFWPADPVHGDWAKAVHFRGGEGQKRTEFRNHKYGLEVAERLVGSQTQQRVEPRAGWSNLFWLAVVLPGLFAGFAGYNLPARFYVIHVDNAGAEPVRIETANGRVIGTAAGSRDTALSLPRTATTLVARDATGREIERVSVGGLEEILDDKYPSLFPDLEFDVGDVFIWNLRQAQCYQSQTHAYGSIGYGGDSYTHRERVFLSKASHPFKRAPSSLRSELPMDSRDEVLRVPCPQ